MRPSQISVSGDAGLKRASAIMLIFLLSCFGLSQATQENDLWLLLSSYEDVGITSKDLAFFLGHARFFRSTRAVLCGGQAQR